MASPSSTHGDTLPTPPSQLNFPSTSMSERLIESFGGIRPMAHKLEIPVTTVQGWKKRGVIPSNRLNDLRYAASRHGIILDENDMKAIDQDENLSNKPSTSHISEDATFTKTTETPTSTPLNYGDEVKYTEFTSDSNKTHYSQTITSDVIASEFKQPAFNLIALKPNLSHNAWAGISLAAVVIGLIWAGTAIINDQSLPLWKNKIGTLEGQMSTVSASQQTTTTTLINRLNTIEKVLPDLNRKISNSVPVSQLLSMSQLRSVLSTSLPFTSELASVIISDVENPTLRSTLDRLTPVASGIATQEDLTLWFSEAAWEISQAATDGNPGARLLDRTTAWMANWARSIHRLTFDPVGTGFRSILSDTSAALATGELTSAVERLSQLTGPGAEAALPWLTAARARLTADRTRALLGDQMLVLSATVLPGLAK
ncbi:hypothetical protein WCLP8_5310001 [uncultured Gammaproteobacteria bacterium]